MVETLKFDVESLQKAKEFIQIEADRKKNACDSLLDAINGFQNIGMDISKYIMQPTQIMTPDTVVSTPKQFKKRRGRPSKLHTSPAVAADVINPVKFTKWIPFAVRYNAKKDTHVITSSLRTAGLEDAIYRKYIFKYMEDQTNKLVLFMVLKPKTHILKSEWYGLKDKITLVNMIGSELGKLTYLDDVTLSRSNRGVDYSQKWYNATVSTKTTARAAIPFITTDNIKLPYYKIARMSDHNGIKLIELPTELIKTEGV